MSERKIINDPVFGFINIPKGLLYNIVCHPLLQRLTRIKQLGLSSAVYPERNTPGFSTRWEPSI